MSLRCVVDVYQQCCLCPLVSRVVDEALRARVDVLHVDLLPNPRCVFFGAGAELRLTPSVLLQVLWVS